MPKIALFSVLSFLLSLIKVPLFFVPNFYKLELGDSIALIGGFSMGSIPGVLILLLKNLLLIFLKGTQTLGIGETANFILGLFFLLPSTLIYAQNRTFKSSILGMSLGIFSEGLMAVILNCYVLLPLYSKILSLPTNSIIAMGHTINPMIHNLFTFAVFAILPFNLIKYFCICILTVLIYKKMSKFAKNILQ